MEFISAPSSRTEQIERLEKFRDGLAAVPPANFDMRNWVWWENTESRDKLFDFPEHQCGAAGCAVGWLPVLFRNEFRYQDGTVYSTDTEGNNHRTADGAEIYFGLNRSQSSNLFMPDAYSFEMNPDGTCGPVLDHDDRVKGGDVTPCMVASRMNTIINHLKQQEESERTIPSA